MSTRREFIKTTVLAGAALAIFKSSERFVWGFSQTRPLAKFVSPLPGLAPTGIPVGIADTRTFPGVDLYRIAARQFSQQMHPDLPPTTLWGYADMATGKAAYLGPAIVARRNRPVVLRVNNELPNSHPLPIDRSLMGADGADNRMCVHLHGGFVPWTSDGGPFSWFTPEGKVGAQDDSAGESFLNGVPGEPGVAEYYYPNRQSARLLWFHDHALGTTRLNAYAGLVAPYLLTDPIESVLIGGSAPVIPANQIPLVIQDKTFNDDGSLWYPDFYDPDRWELSSGTPPIPSCVPEFFADTAVVNGMAYPYLEVQPRRYRFRILNGSQARFYNLQLYYESATQAGEADLSKSGPPFIQIGTEGGFLPAPVVHNAPAIPTPLDSEGGAVPSGPFNLLLAPAERADIIIDFCNVPVNSRLILYSDAPAPFPMGDERYDFTPDTASERGPDIRNLMQFRIVPLKGKPDLLNFQRTLALLRSQLPIAYAASQPRNLNQHRVPVDVKTLNEGFDEFGRLIQKLGTGDLVSPDSYGRNYADTPTEVVHNGETRIWDIYNNTGDTHPMHFHLVNVQVIGRAPFTDVGKPDGEFAPPDPNERGWKETVRMNPGTVTRIIMKFDLPHVPFAVPGSKRVGGGAEYVWHCHILEHEEHDMMRPLVVL